MGRKPARKVAKKATRPAVPEWRLSVREEESVLSDEKVDQFLCVLEDTGSITSGARHASMSTRVIATLRQNDPEFAAAVNRALAAYKDKVLDHARDLMLNGTKEYTYDKEGNVTREKTIYPTDLLRMEMKRVEPDYKEKSDPIDDAAQSTGVLVVPQGLSPEEFVKRAEERNRQRSNPIPEEFRNE